MTRDLKQKVVGVGVPPPAGTDAEQVEPVTPEEVQIQVALARVMNEVRAVAKDQYHDAPGAKFNFRGIDGVVNAVGPALRNHGVLVLPELLTIAFRDVKTSSGKDTREVTVKVSYTFIGPAGDKLTVVAPGEAMDTGDKGTAKAMSVAFRIALLQVFVIPTHDPDPDSVSYERGAAGPTPAQAARDKVIETMQAEELDPQQVLDAFSRRYGEDVRVCDDPIKIYSFVADMRAGTWYEADTGASE